MSENSSSFSLKSLSKYLTAPNLIILGLGIAIGYYYMKKRGSAVVTHPMAQRMPPGRPMMQMPRMNGLGGGFEMVDEEIVGTMEGLGDLGCGNAPCPSCATGNCTTHQQSASDAFEVYN